MADSFYKLEDEVFPSFLSKSLDSTMGRATLGNVTLGSGPGLPVAASTVAKIRPGSDNRGDPVEASYLEGREQQQLANTHLSVGEQAKFALSFKDDLDNADDFIAAHRLSDMLVKINLEESASRNQGSILGPPPTQMGSVHGRPTELGSELSTGLLTFAQFGHKESADTMVQPFAATVEEDNMQSEGVDSDHFSGSNSSFLANEKLMSVDSMNSDITDDDIDLNNLPDDELELYFNKLVPPAMQRGRVDGQEIPAVDLPVVADDTSNPSSTEPEHYRHFLDDDDQEDFQMPDVRLAATGMDSCPASDEDTEDELESARRRDSTRTRLLPSTSRQLVGESNRPSFRPGLEGGSSEDESSSGHGGPSLSGIEHRRSAEGQVINPPVTGDGGGGDGSSGSEESGNDGGVSTIPLQTTTVQTTYDALRGLGIVGEDERSDLNSLQGHMGDRVGPVGTGEACSSQGALGGAQRASSVNWSMILDRQEALDAMESTESGPAVDRLLNSVYLRGGAGLRRLQDSTNLTVSNFQSTQGSFHLSQVVLPDCVDKETDDDDDDNNDEAVDVPDGSRLSLGLRGGPCGNAMAAEALGSGSEDDNHLLSTSLEAKYFSQSFHQEHSDSDDGWNNCPDNLELEFQQGANATHSVVYQDEEGQWVTDLAYYSSFEKEVDGKTSENAVQFQAEDFVSAGDALEKIAKDQEDFEKEHQFMQEEEIPPTGGNGTFQSDSSWKVPNSGHILMRASQVSSEFREDDQSYLRLSFGQFFGQRSEALGCLGKSDDADGVKRPSFGYIINSPEKREPFALIHPSDFSDTSPHNDTVELRDADKTLNTEDLDKTLEAPHERMEPEPYRTEDHAVYTDLPDHSQGSGSESNQGNESCMSPHNNSSHLMLSISTIASAIADASISTDPSQLAAMIMELSKRSKARSRPEPTGPGIGTVENQHPNDNASLRTLMEDQNTVLDELHRTTCVGEVSAFDMDKYLKKTDVTGNSDASVVHTIFDLTGWTDNPCTPYRNPQKDCPTEKGSTAQPVGSESAHMSKTPKPQETDGKTETTLNTTSSSQTVSTGLYPANEFKRSSIPRPRGSFNSARRSVGSGESSTLEPHSDKTAAYDNDSSSVTKSGTANHQVPQSNTKSSLETPQNSDRSPATSPDLLRTTPGRRKGPTGLPCLKGSSPSAVRSKSTGREQLDGSSSSSGVKLSSGTASASHTRSSVDKQVGFCSQNVQPQVEFASDVPKSLSEPFVEESHCDFRPSTSPLIHSSPSQTSLPTADGMASPSSSGSPADKRPGHDFSPQSICSSPSLSRLTYISVNDGTVVPTPERRKAPQDKKNCNMSLSTTIVRFSPTPPMEPQLQPNMDSLGFPKSLDQVQPQHSKSLDQLPPQQCKSPEASRSGPVLSCTRSQSECNYHCPADRTADLPSGCRTHKHLLESNARQLTKVDSGYCSNLNIQQQTSSTTAPQSSQQWGPPSSVSSSVYTGGLVMPSSYSSDRLHYVPIPSFKPQCSGLVDLPHQGDMRCLLTGHSLFTSQMAQQFMGPEASLHPSVYHMGAHGVLGNDRYGVPSSGLPSSDLAVRPIHSTSGSLGIPGSTGTLHLPRPHQSQQELGMMGKPYSQYGPEPLVAGCVEELRGQVVVPEELRFPHACCVGIASQTSLSLFNPSERWQQVSMTITSLAIDGEKVDSSPYHWLIVKNKTIIGPKSTEDQKVLFIPPQAGVYQCVLSVCSWPASAESEMAARASIFAKRVVLVAIAENPAIEVEMGKSGCLDFGDLPSGSAKSLSLKLLNRTHATVPIRLVLSANATAWRCFTLSKLPITMTSEATQQAGHMTPMSSPSVTNHVMHASYGETPESFMVWIHFKAPSKYTASSGELGPADEYLARVDVEVDSPGPTHVIMSIPLRARSGSARVHAPKDLQTVSLSAPLGKSSQQTLPLKNAGNIDVQLKLKSSDTDDCFSVTPDELSLKAGEEQGIVITFKAQGNRKCRESLLTILVLPSGPQYEVTLKGQVTSEDSGKPAIPSTSAFGPALANDIPPILSNKQFVAWGGVTLGRAIQQKLVLRNNSNMATQQLRLLIRGQDQDCFQLQSMFSPEERLTRHGELSIRPREDVTVHMLFAPTRVACMLAKLEIKQSGVRPSQPGVKFTIPLSGYGGTSNIILEDQRKQADGYVAKLADIAVGRVSKVCLCVRNTGSRAAFIKAVAFSDVQSRTVMEPSVISLAPSQFVLKERTQEVITVLMKSTQREQNICQSNNTPLLATVCLFCGDEVSRQQYRKLLQNKPEAARKALSENSLLKNVDFNEKFLGEETVTEPYDLPQRPNEAHIFYGNMSKVVVSLLGSTKGGECEESNHTEMLLPSSQHGSDTDSGLANGNVSLDVLPVKGPQGPVLKVAEPPLKVSETFHKQVESWTIHPEQLLLAAPTINGATTTSKVQIQNNTSRELSFDLSWPAHCLTITPQHGVIEPQCHLQILISPNPSLANKSGLLPWSGQVYVQCDGQQKFIKVQIRGDLALDVSAAPGDTCLAALAPQAATPVAPVTRLVDVTKPLLPLQTPQALVTISNKTIIFPTTPSGETSEAQLEVENGEVEMRWYLSSFAPPYVKGVDNTEDVYRATYTAFRCSRVSGTLGGHEKMQVPITFLPRDRGDYAQFWDLECHPVSEPQQKTRIRFQLCGTGIRSGPVEGPQEGDCSLVKTEATVKSRKKADASTGKNGQEEAGRRGVYAPQDLYTFPATRVGESSSLKVNIRNNSPDTHELKFVNPREPFHIKHSKYSLRSQHYLKLPVHFKPSAAGSHAGLLLIQSETSGNLVIQLTGEASP